MAFSNTVSQTVFNTGKVIDSAVRRCKIPAQQISSEVIATANEELYLFLSALANQNVPLWCIEKQLYPLYDGNPSIITKLGTVDILEATLRSVTIQTAPVPVLIGPIMQTTDFGEPVSVTTVGVVWGSVATDPILLEQSDDGLVWVNIGTAPKPIAAIGEKTWYDTTTMRPARFFRITGVTPVEVVVTANTPNEIPLARLNRDSYVNLPNKLFGSQRPLQFWFDRQVRYPVMRLWPVPNLQAIDQQIVVWAHRQIMDVGTMSQEIEVPQRWYDAVVAGLASRLASVLPEVNPQMIAILDQKAGETLKIAREEERDNSPMMLAPNLSAYTA